MTDAGFEALGEALEGRIRAMAVEGRLRTIEFDPRVMRLTREDLARHVTAAVNSALTNLRSKAPEAEDADPAALGEGMREIRDRGLRSMEMITTALSEAVAQIRERASVTGDPSPMGLEPLVEQFCRAAAALDGTAADTDDLQGMGAGENVRAVAVSGGRISSVEFTERAMRAPSHALAEQAAEAINQALDDLRAKSRESSGRSPATLAEMRALREVSTQQMTEYARSLRELIASIEPRR